MKRTRKKKKIIEETTQPQITSSVDESINPFKVGENIQEKKTPTKELRDLMGLDGCEKAKGWWEEEMVEKGITMATNENELRNCIQSYKNS